jgi:ribulose-5-phosphate 4-epimerase/fuculose-1-phosphate aldolase
MDTTLHEKHIGDFVKAAKDAARYGLVLSSSGNLSERIDNEHMLITESGAWMSDISKDQVALCRIEDGVCLNQKKPSIETGLHRRVMKVRRDINVVLHFQSPYATALACSDYNWKNNMFIILEVPYYIGPVAVIPYLVPGSDDLAEAVSASLKNHNMAVMQNHGMVTVGKDYKETLKRAIFFEFASATYYRAGEKARFLDKKDADFLVKAGQKARDNTGNEDNEGPPSI